MSVVVHGSIYALKLSFLLIKEGGRLCCDCTRPRGNATFGRSHMQGMNGRRRQDKNFFKVAGDDVSTLQLP